MQHGERLTWHPVRVAVLLVVVLLEGIGAVCLVGLTTDLLQQLWEEEEGQAGRSRRDGVRGCAHLESVQEKG